MDSLALEISLVDFVVIVGDRDGLGVVTVHVALCLTENVGALGLAAPAEAPHEGTEVIEWHLQNRRRVGFLELVQELGRGDNLCAGGVVVAAISNVGGALHHHDSSPPYARLRHGGILGVVWSPSGMPWATHPGQRTGAVQ